MHFIYQLSSLPSQFMDIDNCRVGHLIKIREDEKYNFIVQNKEVRRIVLSNHVCTGAQNMKNWLYDLAAPGPNVAAQDDQPANEFYEIEREAHQMLINNNTPLWKCHRYIHQASKKRSNQCWHFCCNYAIRSEESNCGNLANCDDTTHATNATTAARIWWKEWA